MGGDALRSVRCLANPKYACFVAHLPCDGRSSYEYLIPPQSEDSHARGVVI